MARARKTYKSRAQIARAMRERRDNARAVAEGRPMPYPNIWDVLDPTKAPPNATDEQIRERYIAFRALCPPPTRKKLAL